MTPELKRAIAPKITPRWRINNLLGRPNVITTTWDIWLAIAEQNMKLLFGKKNGRK